ncbi:MAG: DUF4399 domain-containing protein [Bdellovibrionales bacterium]|nr:DUF4399 domain-containing protein [Bdellovibrionales bacterium]
MYQKNVGIPKISILCSLFAVSFLNVVVPAFAEFKSQPAPEGAEAYIISPKDGDTVSDPFTVTFGLKGFGVAPAGTDNPMTGHHHLLIDVDTLPPLDRPLPATDNIKHFGGGQTETTLSLPKGPHTIQIVLGDYLHIPHTPPILSKKISITVK